MSNVNIKGLPKMLAGLEKQFGKEALQRVSDKALKNGADVFVEELKKEFEKFKDTGQSIEEITVSKPMWTAGARTVKVHWKGPNDRYRIIHLNEFGTVKNPNPAGKGAIARAMRNAENAYRNAILKAVRNGL
jgi:HK97 gp10 family phage protein